MASLEQKNGVGRLTGIHDASPNLGWSSERVVVQMMEDNRRVVLGGWGHPLVLLGQVGVVRQVLLHLICAFVDDADTVQEVRESSSDGVLIVVVCQGRRTNLWTIRILQMGSRIINYSRTLYYLMHDTGLTPTSCNYRRSPWNSYAL